MKSIRRRLFVSHLVVMVVAIVVFVFVSGVVFGTLYVVGERWKDGRSRGADGPIGLIGLMIPIGSAAAASALVSWRVSERLATPIESMRTATTRIAAGDDVDLVDGGDTTELAQLAEDINLMAHRLATTEERRLQLIGDIGHELRNPLATIEGSMEALMDGVVPATDETFAGVAKEAARLRRLAGDLSALSKAAESTVGNERVDLVELVHEVVGHLQPQAAVKQLDLTVTSDGEAVVVGSRDRLTQVVTNVVGNAVQYTDAGGVRVDVRAGSHRIDVSVTDTGRGLGPDDVERVFERFVRVDDGFAEGTGVGLAIARSIVRGHGGTIEAASPGLGRGSTFTISLPRA